MGDEQITFLGLAHEKLCDEANPSLQIGDTIFIVHFDTVREGKINRNWLCGKTDENPYFGYNVLIEKHCHDTFWDYDIGGKAFLTHLEATAKAEENGQKIVKVIPDDMELFQQRCFEYIRKCDEHKLTATFAKCGELALYEASFCCYHFLRYFKTEKLRDAEYNLLVKKAEKECSTCNGTEVDYDVSRLEALYKVNNELFSSLGYAEHNLNLGKVLPTKMD